MGLAPVGFLNPALYAIGKSAGYPIAFHDITSGDNTWPGSPNLFSAVPGYDLCTGLGTPDGNNLISFLTSVAPLILGQPQDQTVDAGANATFSVIASGKQPLSYQWFFDGKPISAATDYFYSIPRVQSIQGGTYTVVVSNFYGSVSSDSATLAIAAGSGVFAIVGVPFSYQITANNNPTGFSASGLPPGLRCDNSGVILGTPSQAGTFLVTVEAKSIFSSVSSTILFTIADGSITSASSADGIVGVPFSYQIAADNNATGFSASGLPPGFRCDAFGVISGVPASAGVFEVRVEAKSIFTTASSTVLFTISDGSINSPSSVDGIVGVPFSYQITADNNANRFSASGLPPGLHFGSTLGVIYGTPSRSGTFSVPVQAINNNYGSVSAIVVMAIGEGAITSPTSVDGIVGVPFSYQITADNNANRFTASALPSGLHFDSFAGIIYGTPSGSGAFPVDVVAINDDYGSVSATVVITIGEGAITSGTGSQPQLTISRSGESFLLTWPVAFNGMVLIRRDSVTANSLDKFLGQRCHSGD